MNSFEGINLGDKFAGEINPCISDITILESRVIKYSWNICWHAQNSNKVGCKDFSAISLVFEFVTGNNVHLCRSLNYINLIIIEVSNEYFSSDWNVLLRLWNQFLQDFFLGYVNIIWLWGMRNQLQLEEDRIPVWDNGDISYPNYSGNFRVVTEKRI